MFAMRAMSSKTIVTNQFVAQSRQKKSLKSPRRERMKSIRILVAGRLGHEALDFADATSTLFYSEYSQ
jgi:hypothetical protein